MKRDSEKKTAVGLAGSILVCLVAAAILAVGVLQLSSRAGEEGAETLRTAIRRASVQCYAIEGRYPPSVAYLEENYGVQIDRERYHVFYEGFASNIMPDITVIPAEEPEGQEGF